MEGTVEEGIDLLVAIDARIVGIELTDLVIRVLGLRLGRPIQGKKSKTLSRISPVHWSKSAASSPHAPCPEAWLLFGRSRAPQHFANRFGHREATYLPV